MMVLLKAAIKLLVHELHKILSMDFMTKKLALMITYLRAVNSWLIVMCLDQLGLQYEIIEVNVIKLTVNCVKTFIQKINAEDTEMSVSANYTIFNIKRQNKYENNHFRNYRWYHQHHSYYY